MKKIIAIAVLLSTMMHTSAQTNKKTKGKFADNIVVAHRGAWKTKALPQNSIASLQEAVRLGCAGSEFDVHLTADDSLVINHDPEFFGKPIETSTYAVLAESKLSNGETIPTLQQYLTAGMQQHTTRLVLEIKPSKISKERAIKATEKIVALVHQLKAQPWVMYISFDYDVCKKVKELDKKAEVAYLNGDIAPDQIKKDKLFGIDYHFSVFQKNDAWINEAKANKVNLNAWTVDKPEVMDTLISQQFNYITTNEPEMLLGKVKI
jgi:glycerophosphoryl diester phosphodiesterase